MSTIASTSLDPVQLMKTVGTVSGTLIGLSVAMIILGLLGKRLSRQNQVTNKQCGAIRRVESAKSKGAYHDISHR